MKGKLQKSWVLSSLVLMGLTTTLPSVNMVLAETVNETQNTETQDVTMPYDNLLEEPTTDSSDTQQEPTVEEQPTFSLEKEQMFGTIGETTEVVILVDRPTKQVQVTIPQEITIQREELSEGLEVTQMTEEEWSFTAEESTEFRIPVTSETVGVFTIRTENNIDGTIDFLEESTSERNRGKTENNLDDSDQMKRSQDLEENNYEFDEDAEVGIQNVSNWVEFIQAIADVSITTINITSDFETPDNPRQNLTSITGGATTNVTATERFVYMNVRNISRTLVVEGNGHEIDFRSITLCFYDLTATTANPWNITLKDLTIYHGNWYGPLTFNDLGTTNQNASAITYHNITNYGNQLIHSPRSSVRISGKTSSKQMREYTSSFRTWRINATDQTNIYASNLTILEDSEVELETISAGNLDLGEVQTTNNQFKMEKNTTLLATSNGSGGEAEGIPLLVRRGSVEIAEGASATLIPQSSRSAISLRTSNAMLKISENASLSIDSRGTKANANGSIYNVIWMAAGTSLIVENSGELNIQATNMASSPSNIIHVAGNAQFSVGKDAVLDIKSDSTSINQNLIYFASAGSRFTFSDAKRVNLERTSAISGTSMDNGLVRIEGSTGLLDVDVQSVKQWNRGNFEEQPTFSWTPIFNLNLRYTTFTPRIMNVSSIKQEIVETFSANFTTRNVQRVLFERIPDVEVTINPLTGDPSQTNSYRITGTATPKSLVRFSGDPAILEGTLDSPNTSDDKAFHVMADDNGTYQYDLPAGVRFTSGNEVIAYAFLDGKTDTASTIVEEYTPTFPVPPVDPLEPELEVSPENKPEIPEDQGLLSIDFVSQFNFCTQSISSTDKTYYAQPQRLLNEEGEVIADEGRPNYVQISDRRSDANRVGWEISVIQNTQFTNDNGDELAGAQLRFMNQQLATAQGGSKPSIRTPEEVILIPEQKQILLTADEETGTGTWIYRFGDKESSDKSVALDVPHSSNPTASVYQTKLIWELSSVPENK